MFIYKKKKVPSIGQQGGTKRESLVWYKYIAWDFKGILKLFLRLQ